jgi:hypothetical protein
MLLHPRPEAGHMIVLQQPDAGKSQNSGPMWPVTWTTFERHHPTIYQAPEDPGDETDTLTKSEGPNAHHYAGLPASLRYRHAHLPSPRGPPPDASRKAEMARPTITGDVLLALLHRRGMETVQNWLSKRRTSFYVPVAGLRVWHLPLGVKQTHPCGKGIFSKQVCYQGTGFYVVIPSRCR